MRVLPRVAPRPDAHLTLQRWISRGMKRCRQLEEVVRASSETFDRELETQRPIQLADSTLVLVD